VIWDVNRPIGNRTIYPGLPELPSLGGSSVKEYIPNQKGITGVALGNDGAYCLAHTRIDINGTNNLNNFYVPLQNALYQHQGYFLNMQTGDWDIVRNTSPRFKLEVRPPPPILGPGNDGGGLPLVTTHTLKAEWEGVNVYKGMSMIKGPLESLVDTLFENKPEGYAFVAMNAAKVKTGTRKTGTDSQAVITPVRRWGTTDQTIPAAGPINNRGWIAGTTGKYDTASPFVLIPGAGQANLSVSPYSAGAALGINDHSWVCGYAGNPGITSPQNINVATSGRLWIPKQNPGGQPGQYKEYKLDDCIKKTGPTPEWRITQAYRVNNMGQIMAYAVKGGKNYIVMLHLQMDIAVDANRDGTISMAPKPSPGKPVDKTEESKPFCFWLNDDDDKYDGTEQVPVSTPDNQYAFIGGKRDLEDFTRLWFYIGGLQEAIVNGDIEVGLEWKNVTGTPAIWLHRAYDSKGLGNYLTDETAAGNQIGGFYGIALGKVAHNATLKINKVAFQSLSSSNPNAYFIFDGAGEGKGQLVMTFWKGTEKIGEGPGVWLDLKNVRKMYQRGKAVMPDGSDNVPSPFDFGFRQPPDPGMVNVANPDGNNFEQHWDEQSQTIVWVHGWRMTYNEAISWGDTMFKRLWHRGFKGRFATFRWPTYTSNVFDEVPEWVQLGGVPPTAYDAWRAKYNESEYRAWKSGNALKQFMSGLPYPNAKNICAHSMGNIVVSSALKQGMQVNNYILMQAAVPSCVYNVGQASHQEFVDHDEGDPTPDGASDLGYRGFLSNVSGNLVNFYNRRDSALEDWGLNNTVFKPNKFITLTQRYGYDRSDPEGERCNLTGVLTARQVYDPHESMAFVASSRTLPAGHESTGGSVVGNFDLDSNYDFGIEHSAQWKWTIQNLKPFFNRMLKEYGIPSNP